LREPLLLLLLGAEAVDVGDDDVAVEADGEARLVHARELLHHDDGVEEVTAAAAPLLFHPGADEAGLAGGTPDLARDAAVLDPRLLVRHHLALDEGADVLAEELVLLGEDGAFHGGLHASMRKLRKPGRDPRTDARP